jgi:hypothetical protein
MQLLMLLAVLATMIIPSLAERHERMNNIPEERKFLHHMRLKRTIIHLPYDLPCCHDCYKYASSIENH